MSKFQILVIRSLLEIIKMLSNGSGYNEKAMTIERELEDAISHA